MDKEKPRTARSISDKKVLRTELGLSKAAKDFKRANPSAEHLPAYLELLATVQIANPERASRNPEAGARGHDSKQKYLEKRPSTAPRSLGSSQMAPPGSRLNDIRARTQGGQAGDVWSSLMDATQEPASNRISDATTPPYGGTASGSGAAFPIVDDSPPPGPQSSLQASRAPSRAPIGRTALQSPDLFSSVSHGPLDRAGARELGARGGATSGGRPSGRGPGGGSTDLLVQDLDEDFDAMGVSDAFGVAGDWGTNLLLTEQSWAHGALTFAVMSSRLPHVRVVGSQQHHGGSCCVQQPIAPEREMRMASLGAGMPPPWPPRPE